MLDRCLRNVLDRCLRSVLDGCLRSVLDRCLVALNRRSRSWECRWAVSVPVSEEDVLSSIELDGVDVNKINIFISECVRTWIEASSSDSPSPSSTLTSTSSSEGLSTSITGVGGAWCRGWYGGG